MRKVFYYRLFTLCLFFSVALHTLGQNTSLAPKLKVLTYNTWGGRDGGASVEQIQSIASVIKQINPDVVGLQELDMYTKRSGTSRNIAEEIAKLCGMSYFYVPCISFDGGQFGDAILTKLPVKEKRSYPISAPAGYEGRGLGQIMLEFNGQDIYFLNTHLDHKRADIRLDQVNQIISKISKLQHPYILVGDLNAQPDEQTIVRLNEVMTSIYGSRPNDFHTFSAWNPKMTIDYIMYNPSYGQLQLSHACVEKWATDNVNNKASMYSDHLPVYAEFTVGGGQPQSKTGNIKYAGQFSFNGDHSYAEHKALAIAADGGLYLSYNAKSLSVTGDGSNGTTIINTVNTSSRAGLLAKTDIDGNIIWSNLVAGGQESNKNSQITGVCEHGDYLYVIGGVATNVKEPSSVNVFGIPLTSAGLMDYYIAKLDRNTGKAIWAKTFGNTRDWEMFQSLVVDAGGNAYVACSLGNTLAEPLKLSSTVSLTVAGNWGEDYGLIKFDPDGNVVWGKTIGSKSRETGASIGLSVDKDGNVFLTGTTNDKLVDLSAYSDRLEYEIGRTVYTLFADKGRDAMLAKFSGKTGDVLWSNLFTGPGGQSLRKVESLPDGSIIVVGNADNMVEINGSLNLPFTFIPYAGGKCFIAKFDNEGNCVWVDQPEGSMDISTISSDSLGNIYLGGSYTGSIVFGNQVKLSTSNPALKEGMLICYSGTGVCQWASPIAGTSADTGISLINVRDNRLIFSGAKKSEVTLPNTDNKSLFTLHGKEYNWFVASYLFQDITASISNPTYSSKKDFLDTDSYQLSLYDMNGNMVYANNIIDFHDGIISRSSFPSGFKGVYLYTLVGQQNGKKYTGKILLR
uniref:Endonuclease/exonuclease/phosphatase domain-containing protein n=2 Tax=unclassified Prevotella TaxID=2638335 RepID=A0AB33J3I1_9BACT